METKEAEGKMAGREHSSQRHSQQNRSTHPNVQGAKGQLQRADRTLPGRVLHCSTVCLLPLLLGGVMNAQASPRVSLSPERSAAVLHSILQGPHSEHGDSSHSSRHLSSNTLPSSHERKDVYAGRCVAVLDGDSILVEHDGQTERIDLWGVDCPELGQPFGQQARQFTASKVLGQAVRVRIKSHHKGHTFAWVDSGPGSTLNEELVGSGLAWFYPKQSSDTLLLPLLQDTARQDKRGLWVEKDPITPWQWRKGH